MKRKYISPDLTFFAFRAYDILVQSYEESTIAVDNTEATVPPVDEDPWLNGG